MHCLLEPLLVIVLKNLLQGLCQIDGTPLGEPKGFLHRNTWGLLLLLQPHLAEKRVHVLHLRYQRGRRTGIVEGTHRLEKERRRAWGLKDVEVPSRVPAVQSLALHKNACSRQVMSHSY